MDMLTIVAALVLAFNGTIPIDPATTSHVIEIKIPETSIVLDNNGVPTGEIVPFNEDVIEIELKEEKRLPDGTWVDTGNVRTRIVENPVANQSIDFETEPQTWPADVPMRWLVRAIDMWWHPGTEEFLPVDFQSYDYPWSPPSWDYERKTTVVAPVPTMPVAVFHDKE